MYEKQVRFTFSLRESLATDPLLDSLTTTSRVAYWPTAITYLKDSLYAVAGKRNLRTVIEVWQVPMPVLEEFPMGGTPSGFSMGGEVAYKQTVYSEATEGQDMVSLMVPNRGKANAVFVQFYDSRDLYELDYTNAVPPGTGEDDYPLTRILSSTVGTSEPYVPGLADSRLQCIQSSNHINEGFVYMVFPSPETSTEAYQQGTSIDALFLFDHDRDGVLDEFAQLNQTQLENRSLWEAPDSFWIDRGHVTKPWPYQ